MRHLLLFAASVSVLALGGCGTVKSLWSDDTAEPAKPAAIDQAKKADAAPIKASDTEEKEMAALMGEDKKKETVSDVYVEPKEVPPPPAMDMPSDSAAAADAPAEASVADSAASSGPAPAGAPTDCPGVEVLPDTKSITYFDGPEGKPTGSMIARAALIDIKGGCDYTQSGVSVDIDMIMQGKITDKGRYEGRKDLEAFMTFPYFVAIMDPNGKMIDKKIMATAMRFKPNIDDLDHAEKITQTIPLTDLALGPKYTITLGFQLNRAQLDYNRGGSSEAKDAATKTEGKKTAPEKDDAAKADKKPSIPAPTPAAAGSSGSKMQPVVE